MCCPREWSRHDAKTHSPPQRLPLGEGQKKSKTYQWGLRTLLDYLEFIVRGSSCSNSVQMKPALPWEKTDILHAYSVGANRNSVNCRLSCDVIIFHRRARLILTHERKENLVTKGTFNTSFSYSDLLNPRSHSNLLLRRLWIINDDQAFCVMLNLEECKIPSGQVETKS